MGASNHLVRPVLFSSSTSGEHHGHSKDRKSVKLCCRQPEGKRGQEVGEFFWWESRGRTEEILSGNHEAGVGVVEERYLKLSGVSLKSQ